MWNGTLTLTNIGVGRVALQVLCLFLTDPGSSIGRVSSSGRKVTGSVPGRDIPKLLKMVLVALRLARTRGIARTGRSTVRIMWLGVVSCQCLRHNTTMRQRYKSGHVAPCRNQTLSLCDWKNVESDVRHEQTTTYIFLKAKYWWF